MSKPRFTEYGNKYEKWLRDQFCEICCPNEGVSGIILEGGKVIKSTGDLRITIGCRCNTEISAESRGCLMYLPPESIMQGIQDSK